MRMLTRLAIVQALAFSFGAALAADTPADWIEVAAGPMFTVHAPPGTTFERIRTGDAFAGAFHGPGFDLAVEFGYHREILETPNGVTKASATKFNFDDKPGTILSGTSADAVHSHFVALHVPNVESDLLGPLSLIVTTNVAGAADEATVKRIFETVKFGYKN